MVYSVILFIIHLVNVLAYLSYLKIRQQVFYIHKVNSYNMYNQCSLTGYIYDLIFLLMNHYFYIYDIVLLDIKADWNEEKTNCMPMVYK